MKFERHQEDRIREMIVDGCTVAEIAKDTGINHKRVSSRFMELLSDTVFPEPKIVADSPVTQVLSEEYMFGTFPAYSLEDLSGQEKSISKKLRKNLW